MTRLYTAEQWAAANCRTLSRRGRALGRACWFCGQPLQVGDVCTAVGAQVAHYDCTPQMGVDLDHYDGTDRVRTAGPGGPRRRRR